MILKIEKRVYTPVEIPENMRNPESPPGTRPFVIRKHFHMIDHVEDVEYGDDLLLTQLPDPFPSEDGQVTEIELFVDEVPMTVTPKEKEGYEPRLNLIHFSQGGRPRRTVAVEANAYLCSDGGDTLEVIRSCNP